jgi:adenine-specific DNA-methyltransferase
LIKYLGSKRRLVPMLGEMLAASGAKTALDLFTGTTRVAQEFKRRGAFVTAVDVATYSEAFARCYVETDATAVDLEEVGEAVAELNALPGRPGYFTETFCVRSRFVQPHNGARIDAIRDAIESRWAGTPLEPVLLTSLVEAADKVDSTTGVQMAYVKQWADRSFEPVRLRVPPLLPGRGAALRADAREAARRLPAVDLAYLDPPYNQHRYFTNYHVWETLVRWDRPAHYGIACKRLDAREPRTKSVFNAKKTMPAALSRIVREVAAETVVLSYNDESWVGLEDLVAAMRARGGFVEALAFDSKRYVGAQIGIFDPKGRKVGRVGRLRNVEYVVVAGDRERVEAMCAPWRYGAEARALKTA